MHVDILRVLSPNSSMLIMTQWAKGSVVYPSFPDISHEYLSIYMDNMQHPCRSLLEIPSGLQTGIRLLLGEQSEAINNESRCRRRFSSLHGQNTWPELQSKHGQTCSFSPQIERAHEEDVGGMAFVDDSGQVFVSGGDDAVLRVFDLRAMAANNETGSPVGCFPGHKCGITYIDSKVQRADGQRYRKGIVRHETYARISCDNS